MKYLITFALAYSLSACGHANQNEMDIQSETAKSHKIRVATFNVSMYRQVSGGLATDLESLENPQFNAVANIIDQVNPDILLINEFDFDPVGKSLSLFQENYLTTSYPYTYIALSNTGVSSGLDLDKNGARVNEPGADGYGGDAFGFGMFEGQYGFAIVSRYPIETSDVRTFQNFLWKDMPQNLLPTEWYDLGAQNILRLSSKNHVDVPVKIGGKVLHIIAAHPTPPTFDGPEDRNGKRNHDEIRMLADYVSADKSGYLKDDNGIMGGLSDTSNFVILGDLNADPHDGDSTNNAIDQLLIHKRINAIGPESHGGKMAAEVAGGGNRAHKTPASQDTADFRDVNEDGTDALGNLRLDYVLPSNNLKVVGSGVYWPGEDEPGYEWVGPGYPPVSSDHRLVWVDISIND